MAEENPNPIIDDVIQFLEKEREMYGDFAIYSQQLDDSTKATINTTNESEKRSEEISESSITPDKPSASNMDYFDSQDELFNSGGNRKIYQEIVKCKTLNELESLCKKANVLKTDLANTRLVFGVGNPNADLMLIGEAPGAEEDKQGEPFVGRAGQLLNKIITAINFDRNDIYIANILKHRPPQNRNPKPEERKRSLPFLLRQIDLINPKLILCLGRVSANTLLDNNRSLGSMRKEFHPFREKYKLMATYHPAALLRNPNWKRPTWEDVQQLRDRYDELGCKP